MWKPDAYTASVLDRMAPEVRQTYTLEQMQALQKALNPKKSPHAIDFRTRIPLWFTRIYVVFLVGKDRRRSTRRVARERRRQTRKLGVILFLVGLLTFFLGTVFLLGYFLKSELGIDLNKQQHLEDVIPK